MSIAVQVGVAPSSRATSSALVPPTRRERSLQRSLSWSTVHACSSAAELGAWSGAPAATPDDVDDADEAVGTERLISGGPAFGARPAAAAAAARRARRASDAPRRLSEGDAISSSFGTSAPSAVNCRVDVRGWHSTNHGGRGWPFSSRRPTRLSQSSPLPGEAEGETDG